jgi:thymidine kinase
MKGRKTPQFISLCDQLNYAGVNTQVFKPACDFRAELHHRFNLSRGYIVSRTGMHIPAIEVDDKKPLDIIKKLDYNSNVIAIEEVTLFKQPDQLVDIILNLLEDKKAILLSGLDKNFRGEPFHPMPTLMAYATTVQKSYGICDSAKCNRLGEYPQRLINGEPAHYDSPEILVGASNTYEIRCIYHHKVIGKLKNTL